MKNQFAKRLNDAVASGVDYGFTAACMLEMLAYHNIADDYLTEDKQSGFIMALEREMNRIFAERCGNDPKEIAELYVGHVEQIRAKYGLDPLWPGRSSGSGGGMNETTRP